MSDTGGVKIPHDGLYLFGFSATLSSTKAPAGARLAMALYVDSAVTLWEGFRAQDIEIYYETTTYTKENVAVSGILWCEKDQVLTVRNTGEYATDYEDFCFWVTPAGAKAQQNDEPRSEGTG
jgi:hypothetical protein